MSQIVDDIVIWKSNRNIAFLVKQIQGELETIGKCCMKWGLFETFYSKSVGVLFTQKKEPSQD